MPNVRGKKFPYTAAGMKAANKAMRMGYSNGGRVKAKKACDEKMVSPRKREAMKGVK